MVKMWAGGRRGGEGERGRVGGASVLGNNFKILNMFLTINEKITKMVKLIPKALEKLSLYKKKEKVNQK
jgi:hypothetical protein